MIETSATRLPMWKKIRDLLSDAAVYGASSALNQVIAFLLLPLYTRYLSPEDYGIVAMLAVLTVLFVPLANIGMTNSIFRRFNVCRDDAERTSVLNVGLVSVVTVSVSLAAVGMLYAPELSTVLTGKTDYARLVVWSLISATAGSVGAVPLVVLRAERRVKVVAVFNIVKVLTTVGSTVTFLFVYGMGAEAVILGIAIGEVTCTLITFAATFRRFRLTAIDTSVVRSMLSYGLPFVPNRLMAAGTVMLGQYIVRTYLGLESAGFYSAAAKLAVPMAFVVHAIQRAWVPYKFQIHAHDENPKEFFRTAVMYYCAGVSYLWLGVSVWGPELLRLMTDVKFHAAATLVPFIAAIAFAEGMRYMISTGLELGDNMRALPVSSFLGIVTTIVGSAVLIPLVGIPGAALATTLAWVVMGAFLYFIAQRRFPIGFDWPVMWTLIATSGALVAVDLVGQHYLAWPARVALGLVLSLVFPAIALAVLSRSASERDRLKSLVRRLRQFRSAAGGADVASPESTPPIDGNSVAGDPTSANA